MTRFRFALPFVLSAAPIVAGSLGCNGSTGPALKLSVAAGATDGRCAASPPDSPVPASGISTLRVSVLRRSGTTRTFLCDRVFKVPKEHPNLKLPVEEGQNFDIVAEGFTEAQSTNPDNATHGIFRRKAVGALINVDPKGMEQKELDILRLIPTEGSTCAENTLSQSRAFHTATKLPGQVLIVGGIVASSTNPATEEIGDTVQLTNSIEVYDEKTGRISTVTDATPGKVRAFHNAFLLTTTAPYKILLVGGATLDDSTMGALGPNNQFATGPRLVPLQGFTPLTTKAAGAEILVYDPTTKSVTHENVTNYTPSMFQAGGAIAGGGVFSDGVDYMTGAAQPQKVVAALTSGEASPRSTPTVVPRIGASLTAIDASTLLLWGGNYNVADPVGELVTGGATGGQLAHTPATMNGQGIATAFHTATALNANGDVLMTGGFTFNSSGAAMQAVGIDNAVRKVFANKTGNTVQIAPVTLSGYSQDPTCVAGDRFRPAGWESAVTVGGTGRVLVTGGSPTQTGDATCHDCPTGQTSLLCALQQMSLYDAASGVLSKFGNGLLVARFGHTSTLLDSGDVLVLGGMSSFAGGAGTAVRILRDVELVSVRTSVPPVDVTAATPSDADDPAGAEVNAASLRRIPGKPAFVPGTPDKAAQECKTL